MVYLALAVSSGQAAETLAILNLAEAGDHVVASALSLWRNVQLASLHAAQMGIETTFIEDPDDLEAWGAAIQPNTKLFYGETIGNPRNDCLDIPGVAKVAHESGIPLVVDNTVATPYLLNPLALGADIVVHSMTKFIGGHGNSVGGVIVDGGTLTTVPVDGSPISLNLIRVTTASLSGRRSEMVLSLSKLEFSY